MKTQLSTNVKIFAVASLFALGSLAWMTASASAESAKQATPEVIAVKFHADWCGSCKTIAPPLAELKSEFDGKPVLFVSFDLTNETTTRQARLLSSALGVEQVFEQHAPKTGYVLLIDAQQKTVLDQLTKQQNRQAMSRSLAQAVRKAAL